MQSAPWILVAHRTPRARTNEPRNCELRHVSELLARYLDAATVAAPSAHPSDRIDDHEFKAAA